MFSASEVERFWSLVQTSDKDQCWEWNGHRNKPRSANVAGYGIFCARGKSFQAHRISHILVKGPIPAGLHIDHLCRNRGCVNPAHLEAVTRRENILRGVGYTAKNAAKTHCPQGHELSGDNLRLRKNKYGAPWRVCMTCRRNDWATDNRRRALIKRAKREGNTP